jgi:hypothetical protein
MLLTKLLPMYCKRKKITQVLLSITLGLFLGAGMQAQVKKRIKVIQMRDSNQVFVDSIHHEHDVIVMRINGTEKAFDLDSILKEHKIVCDDKIKFLALSHDSLRKHKDFFLHLDEDHEERIQIMLESRMQDGEEMTDHIKILKGGKAGNAFWLDDSEHQNMTIETIIDSLENGKVITKKIMIKKDDEGSPACKKSIKYHIYTDGDKHDAYVYSNGHGVKHMSHQLLNPIELNDLQVLKKAGISDHTITGEPLKVKTNQMKVMRKKTEETDELELKMKVELENASKATVRLINEDGIVLEENEFQTGETNVNYKLDKTKGPFFLVVLQNNRMWGKKITF